MNSKSENIKNYYIKKLIQENTLKYKNTAKEIRLNKENTLENQIWENLITRILKAYKSKNIPYKPLIGCDEKQLYLYLENLLPNDLTMSDYPKWEVDHIKGIVNFDLTNEEEQLTCFNYRNLQPLLITLNRSKLKKY